MELAYANFNFLEFAIGGVWIFLLDYDTAGKKRSCASFDFTKAKARLFGAGRPRQKKKYRSKDVAGLKEAKEELVEIVDF